MHGGFYGEPSGLTLRRYAETRFRRSVRPWPSSLTQIRSTVEKYQRTEKVVGERIRRQDVGCHASAPSAGSAAGAAAGSSFFSGSGSGAAAGACEDAREGTGGQPSARYSSVVENAKEKND